MNNYSPKPKKIRKKEKTLAHIFFFYKNFFPLSSLQLHALLCLIKFTITHSSFHLFQSLQITDAGQGAPIKINQKTANFQFLQKSVRIFEVHSHSYSHAMCYDWCALFLKPSLFFVIEVKIGCFVSSSFALENSESADLPFTCSIKCFNQYDIPWFCGVNVL